MPATNPIYFDSCAFIHLFGKTPEHYDSLEHLVGMAKADVKGNNTEYVIITSAVSLAETSKFPDTPLLPIEQSKKILAFLENEYVQVWQADRDVCEEAHQLIRHFTLKPMDAIHIATAIAAKAACIVTTDTKKYRRDGLLQYDGKIGGMKIKTPKEAVALFLPILASGKDDEKTV
jgi:predicted nucleic acid-binding protein